MLKLEEGSRYPDDDFINEMADEVKVTAEHCGIGSSPMTVDEDDYREDGYITLEKAQEIVLAQLHLDAAELPTKSMNWMTESMSWSSLPMAWSMNSR